MRRERRWLYGGLAALALVLLAARAAAAVYVDYRWYASLGAASLWWLKAQNVVLLKGASLLAGGAFVFVNLYAVRQSVASVVLPRRVGDLEIGEELSPRYLLTAVALGSLALAALLTLPADRWVALAAARRGVPFGIAVRADALENDAAFAAAATREAAMLVPEGAAKWWVLRPAEGVYDFADLDRIFAFAARHGQAVRGHTLVWHAAMEDWTVAALAEGPARGRALLEEYFDRVLGYTAPAIRDWDVANEAVADPWKSNELLKDSPWLRSIGPDYLDLAFRLARRRDPGLTLTYNDYGCEHDTDFDDEKRRRVLALVRGMRDRGVPIDAVGLQGHMHRDNKFSAPKLAGFVRSVRALGLRVLVTELDVIEPETQSDPAERDAKSAALVHAFVSTVLEAGGDAVLCWGLSDRHSWASDEPPLAPAENTPGTPGSARPLPLDRDLRRKPMWHALARAFEGRPWP
ncbi:MAG: endo-1,4-beta-xylanase [Acetobacteraceae bacterium]|nr:endo-1,4-beta-xylanase [Acetobacteraceae bacterium]